MIAYKVSINGSHVLMVGHEDWAILGAHVAASRVDAANSGELRYVKFSAGGLIENEMLKASDPNASEHFSWPSIDLKIGDTVQIEVTVHGP